MAYAEKFAEFLNDVYVSIQYGATDVVILPVCHFSLDYPQPDNLAVNYEFISFELH